MTEIAHLLGFSELSGFSRWFRTEFDCGPISWRMDKPERTEASHPDRPFGTSAQRKRFLEGLGKAGLPAE